MTDDQARIKVLEREILIAEKRIKDLESLVNQHSTALYHLWAAHEAMRGGVFGKEGLTEH